MALEALDARQLGAARQLAQRAASDEDRPDPPGGRAFVLGAASAYEAEGLERQDAAKLYGVAARWLQEALAQGVPAERRGEAQWLLGLSLISAGRYEAARPALLEALALAPNRQGQVYPLLSAAFQRAAHPDLRRALDFNARWLAVPGLSAEERRKALVQRAELLLSQRDTTGCRGILEQLARDPEARDDAQRLRARMLIEEARRRSTAAADADRQAIDAQLDEAIKLLREVQARDISERASSYEAMYLIGVAFAGKEDWEAAQGQFQRTERLDALGPHGFAARLEAADIARRRGEDEEAVSLYRHVLSSCGRPEEFSNPWLTLDELRRRVLLAWQSYFEQQQFRRALELSEDLYPLVSRTESLLRKAEAYEGWARALEPESGGAGGRRSTAARERWRDAGQTYFELARLRFATRFYSDDLWRAAECLARAEDHRQKAAALREYLHYEPVRRRAQALVNLGAALHALGDDSAALAAATQCMDFHADQAPVYQARILASKVYMERKELPQATAALEANLRDDTLMPTSREWRDSLFLLGKLLFDEAQEKAAPTLGAADVQRNETLRTLETADELYRTSLARLREAVARYPQAPETPEAQYLVADGHRLLARLPRERLAVVTVQTTRLSLVKQLREDLRAAVQGFAALQEELMRRQEEAPLAESQELLLRNAYFGRAAALFELEDYEQASEAYADAASRYQQQPEALDALVQLAACYQRLARPAEARGALEQARIVWQQLAPEVAWQETTPFDKEEWQRRLDWLERN
jgi:tetratricopeptide (TPR) repeat protein